MNKITERENFMKMIRREDPDFVPFQLSLLQLVLPSPIEDRAPGFGTGYDWFGVHWTEEESMPMKPVSTAGLKPVLEDISDWQEVIKWPDLSQIDWVAAAKRDVPEKDPTKILCAMMVSGPFERLHALMGFENALVAIITEPDECGAFFSRLCDFKIEQIRYLKKYYDVDMVHFQDDWGSQLDMLFSPNIWREQIKPHIQRVIDAAHEVGVIFNMHSCGKIDRIIDDIVEMGVDMLDSAQPVNDLERWARDFKRKIIFMGGINAQDIVDNPKATDEDIRKEVESKIDLMAKDGYFIPVAYSTTPRVMTAYKYSLLYGKTYYKPELYAGDAEAILKVLESASLSHGPVAGA